MAKKQGPLSKRSCRMTIYYFLQHRSLLPVGTTKQNFLKVTVAQLELDNPAPPNDPNVGSRAVTYGLQAAYYVQGAQVPYDAIFDVLLDGKQTLEDLAMSVFANQEAA